MRAEVKQRVEAHRERTGEVPGLATVLVGDDPASHGVRGGQAPRLRGGGDPLDRPRAARRHDEEELIALVADLNSDTRVSGMLVQLPLPEHIDAGRVIAAIDPLKDVDGLTPVNAGLLTQGRDGPGAPRLRRA